MSTPVSCVWNLTVMVCKLPVCHCVRPGACLQALLQEQEERHVSRAASLKRQIAQLKQELQDMSDKLKALQERKEPPGGAVQGLGDTNHDQEPGDLLEYLHSQIDKAEVNTGARLPRYTHTWTVYILPRYTHTWTQPQ